jgi:hypothetical protein
VETDYLQLSTASEIRDASKLSLSRKNEKAGLPYWQPGFLPPQKKS